MTVGPVRCTWYNLKDVGQLQRSRSNSNNCPHSYRIEATTVQPLVNFQVGQHLCKEIPGPSAPTQKRRRRDCESTQRNCSLPLVASHLGHHTTIVPVTLSELPTALIFPLSQISLFRPPSSLLIQLLHPHVPAIVFHYATVDYPDNTSHSLHPTTQLCRTTTALPTFHSPPLHHPSPAHPFTQTEPFRAFDMDVVYT